MSDLISRQAAIDAFLTELTKRERKNLLHTWSTVEVKYFVVDMLEKLPSAQPEPCEDAVSRKAVYDAMVEKGQRSRRYKLDEIWELNGTEIREALDTVPSVTPEQKRGKWNAYYHGINETPSFTYSCNQCGYSAPYGLYGGKYSQKEWNFCPNCGAKMEGETNEQ